MAPTLPIPWPCGSTYDAAPCPVRRHAQSPHHVPGLLRPLERRRPRHPHPEGSQDGVREGAGPGPELIQSRAISVYCWVSCSNVLLTSVVPHVPIACLTLLGGP